VTSPRLLALDNDSTIAATLATLEHADAIDVASERRSGAFMHTLERWRPSHVLFDLAGRERDGILLVHDVAAAGFTGTVIITSWLEPRVLEAARRSALAHGLRVAAVPQPVDARRVLAVVTGSTTATRAALPRVATPSAPRPSADDLAAALDSGDFGVVYQPKIDCSTGAVLALEALARWYHPRLGLVMPDDFVGIAESSELMEPLTDTVFAQALAWFAHNLLDSPLHLCLNVSARSLADGRLPDRVEEACRAAGVAPSRLTLELTETSAVADPVAARDALTRLRIMGVALALDDFGSGYASLVELARQPFSEIKIDKAFVRSSAESEESRSIIRAIVGLGRSLDLRVIAEGIEDDDTFRVVRSLGCDLMQGDLLGAAMDGDDVLEWLEWKAPLLLAHHRRP
jgi:EAL domain-containing protein (putative c-di-GMP-specific phosphodiesterase class I)